MIHRSFHFIALVLLGIFITPLFSLPIAFLYAMRRLAPELILVGYVFDVYFGAAYGLPYYTLATAALVFGAEAAKRYLLLGTPRE